MTTCLKVNICGAPSSRKSTVCAGLEAKLKQDGINADTSKEYARQYIQQYGTPSTIASELIIYENQYARDKGVADVSEVLLTDTFAGNPFVFGSRWIESDRCGRPPTKEGYKLLEELFTKSLKKLHWFDLVILFPPDDPLVADGTRMTSESLRMDIYNGVKGFMDAVGYPYIVVQGTPDEKIEKCYQLIKGRIGR